MDSAKEPKAMEGKTAGKSKQKKTSGKQKLGRLTAHPYLRKTPKGGRMMASKISQKVGPRGEKSSSESHLAIFSWFPNTRLSF